MMFTENKIYYDNGMLGNRGSVSYMQIYNDGTIPGELFHASYNETALQELVSLLATIEGETFQDKVNGTIDSLTQGLQSITEVVGKGVGLYDAFMELLGEEGSDICQDNKKAKELYLESLDDIPEYWQFVTEDDIRPIRFSEKINAITYQLYHLALEDNDEIQAAGFLRASAKFGNPQALYEYAKYAFAEDSATYAEMYEDAQYAMVADCVFENLEGAKYCLEEAKNLTDDENLLNDIAWLEIQIQIKEIKAIF